MNISLAEAIQYLDDFPNYVEVRESLRHKRDWMVLLGDFSKLAKLEQLIYALSPWNYKAIEEEANKIKITPRIAYFPEDTLILLDDKKDASYIKFLEVACEEKNPIAIDLYAKHLLSKEIRSIEGDYASLYLERGKGGIRSEYGIFRCELSDKLGEFLTKYKNHLSPQFFLLHVINLALTNFKFTLSERYDPFSAPPQSYLLSEMQKSLSKYNRALDLSYKNKINSIDTKVIPLISLIFNANNKKIMRAEALAKLINLVEESPLAKFCVGCCYGIGEIIEKDERKAEAWIQAAAVNKLYLANVVLSSLSTDK